MNIKKRKKKWQQSNIFILTGEIKLFPVQDYVVCFSSDFIAIFEPASINLGEKPLPNLTGAGTCVMARPVCKKHAGSHYHFLIQIFYYRRGINASTHEELYSNISAFFTWCLVFAADIWTCNCGDNSQSVLFAYYYILLYIHRPPW